MLYGHGDDFYNAKNEVKINFSSNVWHGANLDCWPAGMRSRRRIS